MAKNQMAWYEQDLVLANVFIYVKPSELFSSNAGSRMVCRLWNQIICGEEFCKYYFEKSFCVSEPFINDENRDQFSDLDNIGFASDIIDEKDDSEEDLDEDFEEDFEEDLEEEKNPLSLKQCVKYVEEFAIGKKTKSTLSWESNFYRKFLTLVSLLKYSKIVKDSMEDEDDHSKNPWKDDEPFSIRIEKLLEPLNHSQKERLNELLKKWRLSKLLTSSVKVNDNQIVFFNDSGLPHILQFGSNQRATLYLNNICIMKNLTDLENVILNFIPGICEKEKQTLGDIFCGLFSQLVSLKKESVIKRPPTSYLIFCSSKRQEFKDKNPTISFLEIAKELGRMWKDSSDSEKQEYTEKANILKEEYKIQLNSYRYIIGGLDE